MLLFASSKGMDFTVLYPVLCDLYPEVAGLSVNVYRLDYSPLHIVVKINIFAHEIT
jgi:hypothetical protein